MFRFLFRLNRNKLSSAEKSFLLRLRKDFGIKPNDISLYKLALIHKSASFNGSSSKKNNNERLEYLGDAVLDAIVTEHLYTEFPTQSEGFLTKMRSRIVSRYSLNNIAIAIGLDKLVVCQTKNPLAQKHIYGDALEAFIGAIYLDRGFVATSKWVKKYIFKKSVNLDELQATETDYKSRIIEIAQKYKYSISFNSNETESSGSQIPNFESKLLLNGKVLGTGFGSSKKEAEQNASMVALERIDIISLVESKVKLEPINWEN